VSRATWTRCAYTHSGAPGRDNAKPPAFPRERHAVFFVYAQPVTQSFRCEEESEEGTGPNLEHHFALGGFAMRTSSDLNTFADAIPAELCCVEGGGTFANIGAAIDAGIDKLYKLQDRIEDVVICNLIVWTI
jgi:hypothetical protein